MRPPRAVLRALQSRREPLKALIPRQKAVSAQIGPRNARTISSRHLRQPSPELVNRLETVASTQQLRSLLPKAVEAESPLVSTIAQILRDRNELEYGDCTYILRDIRYALSNKNRDTPVEQSREAMQSVLRRLREEKKWLDEGGQAETVRINVLLGDEAAMGVARQTVERWGDRAHWPTIYWNAYVELLFAQKDVEGLVEALQTFRERFDADIPARALEYIVVLRLQERIDSKSEITVHDLVAAVESLGPADITSKVWAAGVWHLLEQVPDPSDVALRLLDTLRDRGVETDYKIALALVSLLCTSEVPHLDQAMVIYTEYLASGSAELAGGEYDNAVLTSLLSACAGSLDAETTKTALRILNDMRARRLSFPTPTLTSLAVQLIKASPDHHTAFSLYAHLYALNPRALDRAAYDTVLAAFVKLSTHSSPFAPAKLYLEIVGDIRKAGLSIGLYPITSLLRSYGLQARTTRSTSQDVEYRQSKLTALMKGISELHTKIKLDPSIHVDIPLLNALMDAYARVGAYSESFEVWDELLERRPRERREDLPELYSPSINIYLDACGYSYSLLRARKAWAWAGRWGVNGDRRNWEAWLECLCRCGRLDEAFDTVRRMREGAEAGAPAVTKGMVAMLLKFSWRNKESYRTVKERVREEFPEYWDELKEIVSTRSLAEAEE